MNKAELINAVAEATKLSQADADRAVEAVLDTITGALKKGDQVVLVGFGTFTVKAARRTHWSQSADRPDHPHRCEQSSRALKLAKP